MRTRQEIRIGFIGLGQMGSAVARAVAAAGNTDLLLSQYHAHTAQALQEEIGGRLAENDEIVQSCEVIFLGVKPDQLMELLASLAPLASAKTIWVSMAAGISLQELSRLLPKGQVVRMMPNTPVAIGRGMTTYATSQEEVADLFEELLSASGQVMRLTEEKIDAATAIAGCGPAFFYEMIDAMTQAGVELGLTSEQARQLAAHTMVGSGQLVVESGQHPAVLREAVCSPGGSTIAGVHAMTAAGFQSASLTAVQAAYKRTKELANAKKTD